jgi:hypothetical protein
MATISAWKQRVQPVSLASLCLYKIQFEGNKLSCQLPVFRGLWERIFSLGHYQPPTPLLNDEAATLIHSNLKMALFWDIAPCSLAKTDRLFRSTCWLYHQGIPMQQSTTYQKTAIFILVALRIWNLTSFKFVCDTLHLAPSCWLVQKGLTFQLPAQMLHAQLSLSHGML